MRFLVIALAAAVLALPVASTARAAHADKSVTADYAAKKKAAKKKMAKRTVRKKKKAKVEYMRAVPYK